MCFLEFIGYTCGHTSLPVIRPCPLTTASHTFPTCTRRADKPFLAGEMCSPCQKIVHSRATQIEEFEHRFMHERGVCGCDTVFPYLIRPRFIGRGRPAGLAEAGEEEGDGTATTLPPLLDETDGDGCAVVSVRLPSLFAAEWVVDHRVRHEAGLCRCRVDFRTYQQAVAEQEEAEKAYAEGGQDAGGGDEQQVSSPVENTGSGEEEDACNCGAWTSQPLFAGSDTRRTVSSSPPRWRRRYGDADIGGQMAARRESSTDGCTASQSCTHSHDRGGTASPLSSPDGQAAAADAAWLCRCASGMNLDGGCGDGCGDGVRFAGAIFAEVPAYLPITGPFLMQPSPFGVPGGRRPLMDGICPMLPAEAEPGAEAVDRTDEPSSPLLMPQNPEATDADPGEAASTRQGLPMPACTRVPLVGFPIGAGPEGVSHALPWESRPRCWRRF